MIDTSRQIYDVRRWRFFVNTCWVSITAGFLIYVLTLVFDFPYGWASFLLVGRAVFWSLGDMTKLSISISPDAVEGPGLLLTSNRRAIAINDIKASKTGIRSGRFFIEDQTGKTISSRLSWYDPQEQEAILDFLGHVSERTFLDLADFFKED